MHKLPLWACCHRVLTPELPRFRPFVCRSPYATVSTSIAPNPYHENENEYIYIEDVEPMGRYRPGGYYLVAIGDKLQDRYRVIHKPGHGGYSTTWLARDERSQKLAAMKVGTAESNPHEANILSAFAAPQIPPHVGRMADIAYFLFWTG